MYGDGLNVRDWLYVEDHCRALDMLIAKGINGEVYNIGGGNDVRNIDLTKNILSITDRPDSLITKVPDRLGHDRRYSLNTTKIRKLGNWKPEVEFLNGLQTTVKWYQDNEWWWRPIKGDD